MADFIYRNPGRPRDLAPFFKEKHEKNSLKAPSSSHNGYTNCMIQIHTGDLIFVRDSLKPLSALIAASTQAAAFPNYVHVALIEIDNQGDFFVLHASNDAGCIRQPLNEFLKESATVDIYRLKDKNVDFPGVIARAKTMLGSPYNPSFSSDQPGYYCSQFIYEAFRTTRVFKQTAMSFGPKGSILPAWRDYYRDLHFPIPNGQAGSSPNSLIRQNKLDWIGSIQPKNI